MSCRETVLFVLLLAGCVIAAGTEMLSALHLVRRVPLALLWLVALAAVLAALRRRVHPSGLILRWPERIAIVAIATICAAVAVVAWFAPPNSADAMAYHMPRVVYWAQQQSVHFFPTPYLNQIMLQPLAEYTILHTYVLSGGDHFANLVQFVAMCGSIVAVSLIAREFGAGARGQVIAALLCATLPNGILQASGAKNDYVAAFWLASFTFWGLAGRGWPAAVSLALAVFTKATAYLFGLPVVITLLLLERLPLRWIGRAAVAVAIINGPLFWRNFELSGSVLGFDSAHGDGFFRWRNEELGAGPTLSNALRHLSEQLSARSDQWNRRVFELVVAAHARLGLHPQDPRTTWRWSEYKPPKNANQEADSNNRWHLALFLLTLPWLGRRRDTALLAAAVVAGFLLFCAYLKWQPFMARMWLPLFVAMSPLTAVVLEKQRWWLQLAVCLFLLDGSKPYLKENWTRPLIGANSVLRVPRPEGYFNDMVQWSNRQDYQRMVRAFLEKPCAHVGLDINHFTLEYPFQALVREARPHTRFVHTGVTNPSVRYGAPESPCAIVCLGCAGKPDKAAHYSAFPNAGIFGDSVLFSR